MSRHQPLFPDFLYGAAVYPEFMPRDEWLRLLDDMLEAKMNTVRLMESAWGFLEPEPGQRRHGEAVRWLDDARERGLRCILGTGSFLPPQWFFVRHPDALVLTRNGERAHPLARKSACLEHPAYREAVREQSTACAQAWAGHPSAIAWQLDNEIDRVNLDWTCHCPRCEEAWTGWLFSRYGTVEELNRRMRLDHWGLELPAIENLPLPRVITELGRHPGLAALEARFRRDRVNAFLREQGGALRAGGARQPFGHNFFATPDFSAEEPGDEALLDFGSYDLYLDWEPVEDTAAQVRKVRFFEQQRACHDGDFLLMETSMGVVGGQAMVAPAADEATFFRRLMLAVACGARGVLYWTGTVWRGGPWIFHGALHDYAGYPVPEMPRIRAFGEFLKTHGPALLATPVRHDVAVIGSHAGNALAASFPVYPGSDEAGRRFETACRARGLAVDVLTPAQAVEGAELARFRMVALFGEAQGLVSPAMVSALVAYAEAGGTVVVGPLAGYVSEEGVVDDAGLAARLRPLTGITVPVFRWFGDGALRMSGPDGEAGVLHGLVEATTDLTRKNHKRAPHLANHLAASGSRLPHRIALDTPRSPGTTGDQSVTQSVALPCDLCGLTEGLEIAGRLISEDEEWNGRPARLRRTLGDGVVWKYLATPEAGPDSEAWGGIPPLHPLLAECLPSDVLGVPRDDGSLLLVNMRKEVRRVAFTRPVRERFAGTEIKAACEMEPQSAIWVESSRVEFA